MDYSKSLPSPDQPGFAANLKPVRRRLQKLTPKTNIFHHVKRSSHDSGISTGDSPPAPREMNSIGNKAAAAGTLGHNPFADEPVLPLPPDLSDSKWLDYIERTGLMFHEPTVTESVPKPMRKKPPPAIIPEFSHLLRPDEARPSLDSTWSDSPPNSASTESTMRRRAKTPVFRIGQLEGKATPANGLGFAFGRDPWVAEKTSSVELIAEQYCALLEHRDALEAERQRQLEKEQEERENDAASSIYSSSSSIYTSNHSEPALVTPYSAIDVPHEPLCRHSFEDGSPVNIILEPVRSSAIMGQQSPASTNGTFVGCDESAIYFKPVSFAHGPPSHFTETTEDLVPPPVDQQPPSNEGADSLSLHICLDLLTKELSSAFANRSGRSGDASALQVWVMIEAYERLQDQIAIMEDLPEAQRRNMQMIFRSWLGTLYNLHDMLSGKPVLNERDMEGLTEEVD